MPLTRDHADRLLKRLPKVKRNVGQHKITLPVRTTKGLPITAHAS